MFCLEVNTCSWHVDIAMDLFKLLELLKSEYKNVLIKLCTFIKL